ncbi:MAG: hypothetical protein A4E42_01775 [Methanoregulaceae archaeon PtaU1.Bin222]|nr:MAG: hypothetical protein A4E42_01775 [Methanoregulaceae archaeon PtaU1.Bin222]
MISLEFSTSERYFSSLSRRAFSVCFTAVMSVSTFMIAGEPSKEMTVPRILTILRFPSLGCSSISYDSFRP